jgi:predicted O-methyltransferase YrrM
MAVSSRFAHVLAGEADRKTRLHNERGERLRLNESLVGLIGVLKRWDGRRANEPWMVPSAVAYLDANLRRTDRLLEMGSGASTAWYASRVRDVVSLEPDKTWFRKTSELIAAQGTVNVTLVSDQIADSVARLRETGEQFDVIVVDSTDTATWTRVDGARAAMDLVVPGGMVILDDSDRARYSEIDSIFGGWKITRLKGMKARPIVYTETTAYTRSDA